MSQSQQQMQAADIQEEEIRMSISLPYVEGTREKLPRTLKSHKIKSTFYKESTLRKVICKLKGPIAKEGKTISFMKLTVVTAK